ncbi:unnamed protein product [Hydatigera taeniaeformis]|uniref:CASP-like protein n=1 Tax=Hydatigena taeniaeformis TaxID=6205 RepID=A0A0R3WSP4_HYDTA|nr:unnamed protein product [Hydatigera taeniaeformis]
MLTTDLRPTDWAMKLRRFTPHSFIQRSALPCLWTINLAPHLTSKVGTTSVLVQLEPSLKSMQQTRSHSAGLKAFLTGKMQPQKVDGQWRVSSRVSSLLSPRGLNARVRTCCVRIISLVIVSPANLSRSSWAWLVLLSAFFCTAVIDGLILSFGLHVLEMMEADTFTLGDTNTTNISFSLYLLPGALLTGMHLYASKSSQVTFG